MVKNVVTVKETQSVYDACQLMQKNTISSVIVVKDKSPVGIFTERDLVTKVVATGKEYKMTKMADVMTVNIKTADISASYQDVYDMMSRFNIRHMPIVDKGTLVAIVSMRDLLRYNYFSKLEQETISSWMIKEVVTCSPSDTVYDAGLLMHKNNIGSVIVEKDRQPIGIITERDLLTKVIAINKDYRKTLVSEVMSTEIKSANTTSSYREVYEMMSRNNIRHMPIVENGALIAIVSIRDLLRFNMRSMEQIIQDQARELNFLKGILAKTNDERSRELYRLNEKLQSLVIVDSLTGLYNHKYFEEILPKEVARAKRYNRPLTLLFIDIDFFKHYNDMNGHERGNMVLKQLAEVLQKTSRHSDTVFKMTPIDIVARYGGEEFVVVLPETDKKGGIVRAKRLLSDVKEYPFYNREAQPGGYLTVSIGVAEFPGEAVEWTELIKKADEALYEAKNTGRNKVI